jgi:methylmalonyl-CoA mutase cobalamin-binding subunit
MSLCKRMKKGVVQGEIPPRRSASAQKRLRILTAVPMCDGHDSPIVSINAELVKRGTEVVYLGYRRSVRDIVRAQHRKVSRPLESQATMGGT